MRIESYLEQNYGKFDWDANKDCCITISLLKYSDKLQYLEVLLENGAFRTYLNMYFDDGM